MRNSLFDVQRWMFDVGCSYDKLSKCYDVCLNSYDGIASMLNNVSSIWQSVPADLTSQLNHCLDEGCSRLTSNKSNHVFFRADDVAVPGTNFSKLLDIFTRHSAPLCLAVVPAWITSQRWDNLVKTPAKTAPLWCWHQHGWRHVNHEEKGGKQEFGPLRTQSEIRTDLIRGRRRLEEILGKSFLPVFTPPWNRCSLGTLQILQELVYMAVSQYSGKQPFPSVDLPDFFVNVDLHTRKEKNVRAGWENLFEELKQGIATGHCGIMIHHRRMNAAAFDFLEILLIALLQRKALRLVHFGHLMQLNH